MPKGKASRSGLQWSIDASVGLTNEVSQNFINNAPPLSMNLDFQNACPLCFRWIILRGVNSWSQPLCRFITKVNDQLNAWFTPILEYAQRLGVKLAGFNLGRSFEVVKDVSLVAEVGANFMGRGNSFNQTRLVDRILWTLTVRWNLSA